MINRGQNNGAHPKMEGPGAVTEVQAGEVGGLNKYQHVMAKDA